MCRRTPAPKWLLWAAIGMSFMGATTAADVEHPPGTLDRLWSFKGPWTGVAADEASGRIYALGTRGALAELDVEGNAVRTLELPGADGKILRLAEFGAEKGTALLTFRVWGGRDLRVHDLAGKALWSYRKGTGIDDVWADDLDGDGKEEVIVGYNGSTGLHVLDIEGKILWTSTGVGNVWSVHVGHLSNRDGSPDVIVTSGKRLEVFAGDGALLRSLDPGCLPHMNRIVEPSGTAGRATVIVACGAGGRNETMSALDGDGTKRWSLALPGDAEPRVATASVAPGRPWIAIGSGSVYVLDTDSGKILASVSDQGHIPELAWATKAGDSSPLLLVATGKEVAAYRVTP